MWGFSSYFSLADFNSSVVREFTQYDFNSFVFPY